MMFGLRSIRSKFIVALLPIFLLGLGIPIYYSYTNSVRHFGELGHEGLENAVNLAYILCEEENKNVEAGKISLAEAKERVRLALNGPLLPNGKRDLSKVRVQLGEEGYFFAIDSAGKLTLHPILPVGTDLSKYDFIQEFIRTKNGSVYYKWKYKGEAEKRDKLAVFRYFAPWDWIIGTAVYMDHFTAPAKDQLHKSIFFLLLASALFLVFLFAVVFSITSPLKRLQKGVEAISSEHLETIDGIQTRDEVGSLADAVNHMILGLREKKFIKETFGKYVSKQVQEAILSKKIPLQGEKKQVTLLFIDIRNFTPLSESLSPEELVEFLNDYFTNMVDAILSQEGTIDKFIGDAIMAVFGAPISREDDTKRALRAAELLMRNLDSFNKERQQKGLDTVNIGVGIHTGEVIAGNIGTEERLEYTVVGDTVNLASRIESLTKKYGLPVIFSDSTYRELMHDSSIKMRELDSVRVKGRKRPVVLYEFYGFRSPEEVALIDETLSDFLQGIMAYKIRAWKGAVGFFQKVVEKNPDDKIAKMYIERCHYFMENPVPEDWDGVFVYKQK